MDDHNELRPAPLWASIAATVTRRLPRGKSRIIEWIGRGSKHRFIARMPAQLGAYFFDCSLRDMVARNVFLAGCYATQEISFLRGVLQRGMTFVDVGANWGLFTLVARHLVGNEGRVLALEPDPRLFRKLKSNLERNQLHDVTVLEVAAADVDANMRLVAHDHGGGNWGVSRLAHRRPDNQSDFLVVARTLDALLDDNSLRGVDLVKIDVEGAEDLVIGGMRAGLISQRYKMILLELHPLHLAERSQQIGDITSLLLGKGYLGYSLNCGKEGVRKAYYHPWSHFSEYIMPLDKGLDVASPHTLWLSAEGMRLAFPHGTNHSPSMPTPRPPS